MAQYLAYTLGRLSAARAAVEAVIAAGGGPGGCVRPYPTRTAAADIPQRTRRGQESTRFTLNRINDRRASSPWGLARLFIFLLPRQKCYKRHGTHELCRGRLKRRPFLRYHWTPSPELADPDLSPLHAHRTAAAHERFHFVHSRQIYVAFDRVLKRRRGCGEINGVLQVAACEHSIDKARVKGVAAADPVYNAQIVFGAKVIPVAPSLYMVSTTIAIDLPNDMIAV